jgi:hypothetical protein
VRTGEGIQALDRGIRRKPAGQVGVAVFCARDHVERKLAKYIR